MVLDTLSFQDASTHQILDPFLKWCRRYATDTIILEMRSKVNVTVTQKWCVTHCHPNMHQNTKFWIPSHTKFGMPISNNIGDMAWTQKHNWRTDEQTWVMLHTKYQALGIVVSDKKIFSFHLANIFLAHLILIYNGQEPLWILIGEGHKRIIPVTVPWFGQQCVIVVFPNHAHLLFGQNLTSSLERDALWSNCWRRMMDDRHPTVPIGSINYPMNISVMLRSLGDVSWNKWLTDRWRRWKGQTRSYWALG